jgi:hypothetical protein
VLALDEQERAERGADGGAGGVTGRRGGRLHAVVLEDGHLRESASGRGADGVPEDVGEDARGDGDAEGPSELDGGVEVRDRHGHADDGAHDDGAERELGDALSAVHVRVPAKVLLFGRGVRGEGREVLLGGRDLVGLEIEAGASEHDGGWIVDVVDVLWAVGFDRWDGGLARHGMLAELRGGKGVFAEGDSTKGTSNPVRPAPGTRGVRGSAGVGIGGGGAESGC